MVHSHPDEDIFDDEPVSEIEISSEEGIPLAEALDYEDLNPSDTAASTMSPDDYEEL